MPLLSGTHTHTQTDSHRGWCKFEWWWWWWHGTWQVTHTDGGHLAISLAHCSVLDLELKPDIHAVSSGITSSEWKRETPGPLALTEQMFSPPPSLERWPTLTAEKSWLKFGLEWQQHNDCSSSVTVRIRLSLYLDGTPLNSGSQFSSTHSQKGSFRLAGSHLINTKPLYSSHFLLYLLMDQNKISKHVHDISRNPSAPSFQSYDSTEREKFMLCVFCRYRARTVKRENRLGYDWNSNDLCCIDFG